MDDLTTALSSLPRLILDHWIFLVVSFVLGMVGQVFKLRVWTKEAAARSRFVYWVRAFLPLHAPFIGFVLGFVLVSVWGEQAPVGPGVSGAGQIVVYYTGAGGVSAWVVSLWKHLMQSRGIVDPHRPSITPESPGEVDIQDVEGAVEEPPPLPLSARQKRNVKTDPWGGRE